MTAWKLLQSVRRAGALVGIAGNELRERAPHRVVTIKRGKFLRTRTPEIYRLLSSSARHECVWVAFVIAEVPCFFCGSGGTAG